MMFLLEISFYFSYSGFGTSHFATNHWSAHKWIYMFSFPFSILQASWKHASSVYMFSFQWCATWMFVLIAVMIHQCILSCSCAEILTWHGYELLSKCQCFGSYLSCSFPHTCIANIHRNDSMQESHSIHTEWLKSQIDKNICQKNSLQFLKLSWSHFTISIHIKLHFEINNQVTASRFLLLLCQFGSNWSCHCTATGIWSCGFLSMLLLP